MIINYDSQYENKISKLVEEFPMEWGGALPTVIAIEQNAVVGVGSLSTNDFHPYREYLKVFVHPEKRRTGIGRAIFEALYAQSNLQKFQAAISSKDIAGVSFLESCGFKLARKSYVAVLRNENSDATVEFPTLYELSAELQDEVLLLQLENYREFHEAINPISQEITFQKWKDMVANGLTLKHSYVWIDKGSVEAYVLCYEGDETSQFEIGYVGGRDITRLEEYTAFYEQVADQLMQAFEMIELEADNVDPYASALLNSDTHDQSDSWDTYIRG